MVLGVTALGETIRSMRVRKVDAVIESALADFH